jgi:hypothetical protein
VAQDALPGIDVVGSPGLVTATIAAYRQAGVQIPVIFPLTWGAAQANETAAPSKTHGTPTGNSQQTFELPACQCRIPLRSSAYLADGCRN